MNFREWLKLHETGTSTADIAGFSRITIPLVRRWWISDWEEEQAGKKKKKRNPYKLPQVEESTKYKFACAMFDLDKQDADKVLAWSKKNIPDDVLFTDGEKGREDEIHVTVLYGLHSDDHKDAAKIIQKFKPDVITFGEVSKFESDKYDVLKLSVEGSILRKMNKALKELPYTSNFPTYNPHCTLAYVKKGTCDHLLGKRNFDGFEVTMNSVTYSPSEGEHIRIPLS